MLDWGSGGLYECQASGTHGQLAQRPASWVGRWGPCSFLMASSVSSCQVTAGSGTWRACKNNAAFNPHSACLPEAVRGGSAGACGAGAQQASSRPRR